MNITNDQRLKNLIKMLIREIGCPNGDLLRSDIEAMEYLDCDNCKLPCNAKCEIEECHCAEYMGIVEKCWIRYSEYKEVKA